MTSAGGKSESRRSSRWFRSAKFRKSPLVEFPAIGHPLQFIQRAVQKVGLADLALNLAAGSSGDASSLEQHHRVRAHVVLFGYGPPDSPHHRVEIQRQTPIGMSVAVFAMLPARVIASLDLGGDDQPFLVEINRKGCATPWPQRRMAVFHGQFNILGIDVTAVDDDQILQASGDK